jgi:4-hydroxy-3-methylbut-2-en-1-yl diphosphate reductase
MGTVEQVLVARRTGFCYGVREAIDYAKLAAAQGKQTHTLGQVVHNEGVIAQLQGQGIVTVDTLDDVDHGAAVVIRAHGVTPEVMAAPRLRASRSSTAPARGSCRSIASWPSWSRRATRSCCSARPSTPRWWACSAFAPDAIVVDEEEDWGRIPRTKRMALISQSTQPPWKFEKLAAYLVGRCHELKVVNTSARSPSAASRTRWTCPAKVDLMVVVGGRNSANTKELTRLCEIAGKPVVQIEGARDLTDAAVFDGPPWSASPAAPRRRSRTCRRSPSGSTSWPARTIRRRAAELARAAITAVAEPAYRSSSLDEHGQPVKRQTPIAGAA